ncbi:MAG: U32 family peptidase [Clostridia bacterium]|nr:U32 family peptidase [Clostridia bacterium]
MELLAPAGNMNKLKTALLYGADAVYLAGKRFGLRAYADNFSEEELREATEYVHSLGKKLYVTVNIYADDSDLPYLPEYAKTLEKIGVDGVIISDLGVFTTFRENSNLDLHVSTQANVTNSSAAKAWASLGAKRIILARETSLKDIRKIRDALPEDVELEAFVHGAMCIAYSGRCLLSSYFTERAGNKGECVQCCRWEYDLVEKSRNEKLVIEEDERGTYLLSSKDLRMLQHLDKLRDAGVASLKIEGRIKSEYYVAGVVNAYRRALDDMESGKPFNPDLLAETEKISHRGYTTGFFFNERGGNTGESKPTASHNFIAVVKNYSGDWATVEMRNRFAVGDELEVLSPTESFGKTITVTEMTDEQGCAITVADKVQASIRIKTDVKLSAYDILRKKA